MIGLWYTHRMYKRVYRRSILDDILAGHRPLELPYFARIRPSDKIAASIYRVMRRRKLTSISAWNALVELYLENYGTGGTSIRTALLILCRERRAHRPVVFSNFIGRNATTARAKYWTCIHTARERLESIRKIREARKAHTCAACQRHFETLGATTLRTRWECLPPERERGRDSYDKVLLCVSCWNKRRPIIKQMYEANDLRKLSNQLKRAINERKKA